MGQLKRSACFTAMVMALSLSACQSGSAKTLTGTLYQAQANLENESELNRKFGQMPESWNPHSWINEFDAVMLEYVTTPFAAVSGEDIVYGAAVDIKDITADYKDKEAWGIEGEAGYVFQIDLNPEMTWEDGTPINADTYIQSMKLLLDQSLGNVRAGRYMSGPEAIRGANGFYNSYRAGEDIYTYAEDGQEELYLNPSEPCYFFGGYSMADYYYDAYASYFVTYDEVDLFQKFSESGDWILVTDEVKAELEQLCANFGYPPESYISFCSVKDGVYEEVSWDEVGLIKTGQNQMLYITQEPMAMEEFLFLMNRNWAVHPDGYSKDGYNTISGESKSFGPYITEEVTGESIKLAKNENWFGWDNGLGDQYPYESVTLIKASLEPAPFPFEFKAKDIYGDPVTQEDLGEKEVFFVHFWGTWCGPCVEEMPDIAKVAEAYGERVGFLGLLDDYGTASDTAVKLTEASGIPFINIDSKTPELAELMELLTTGYVPSSVIIDSQGNMLGEQIIGAYGMGYADVIDGALAEAVTKLGQ